MSSSRLSVLESCAISTSSPSSAPVSRQPFTSAKKASEPGRTLREVSAAARVSLGYLSEVERGRKEASSELLAAICEALDISLPDASVVETVTMLRRRRPNLPILIVSMHAEEQYAVNLLRAGASGFFPKAGEAKDLLEAIRTVSGGRKYISATLAEVLALEATGNAPEPAHRQLSNREFQVFVQLACGKTVTQIAEEVHLSVKTISTYRTRILQKMNCSRNADLTAYALQHNLMGAPPPDIGVRGDVR